MFDENNTRRPSRAQLLHILQAGEQQEVQNTAQSKQEAVLHIPYQPENAPLAYRLSRKTHLKEQGIPEKTEETKAAKTWNIPLEKTEESRKLFFEREEHRVQIPPVRIREHRTQELEVELQKTAAKKEEDTTVLHIPHLPSVQEQRREEAPRAHEPEALQKEEGARHQNQEGVIKSEGKILDLLESKREEERVLHTHSAIPSKPEHFDVPSEAKNEKTKEEQLFRTMFPEETFRKRKEEPTREKAKNPSGEETQKKSLEKQTPPEREQSPEQRFVESLQQETQASIEHLGNFIKKKQEGFKAMQKQGSELFETSSKKIGEGMNAAGQALQSSWQRFQEKYKEHRKTQEQKRTERRFAGAEAAKQRVEEERAWEKKRQIEAAKKATLLEEKQRRHAETKRAKEEARRAKKSRKQASSSGAREFLKFGVTAALLFITFFGLANGSAIKERYFATWNPEEAQEMEVALQNVVDSKKTNKKTYAPILPTAGVVRETQKEVPPLALTIAPPERRIIIPKIGKNVPIVSISDSSLRAQDWDQLEEDIQVALRDGVVHYPGTAEPREIGNTFITGHSSYYFWDEGNYKDVFARLHDLEVGDEFTLFWDQDIYHYKITERKVVSPKDTSVLDQPNDKQIVTLMTCTPIGTAINRLILVGELVEK